MSLFTIRDHTVTISQGRERECKVLRCELEEALNRMKIMYWIKNTFYVFRKVEDISARKFELIICSSHVPPSLEQQAVSKLSADPPAIIFRSYPLTSNDRLIVNNEVENILQGIIVAYIEVPSV